MVGDMGMPVTTLNGFARRTNHVRLYSSIFFWVFSGICGCMSSSSASHHEDGADGWERNTTLSGRWYLSPASHEQHPVPTDGDHGCESLSSGGRNGVSGRPVPVSVRGVAARRGQRAIFRPRRRAGQTRRPGGPSQLPHGGPALTSGQR